MQRKQTSIGVAGAGVAGWLLLFTQSQEGLKLYGYLDPVGVATKCYGDTHEVVLGHKYSKEECKASLENQLTVAALGVKSCVPMLAVHPGPFAAATDFAYNAGVGAFCKSSIANKFRSGNWAGGCAELSKWIYAGGKVLPGLVKRRAAERKKCEENEDD